MNSKDLDQNTNAQTGEELREGIETSEVAHPQRPEPQRTEGAEIVQEHIPVAEEEHTSNSAPALDRKKLLMLGGGLGAAVLFFLLTMTMGHSSHKRVSAAKPPFVSSQSQASTNNQGSITPVMDPERKADSTGDDGQLTTDDIERMRPAGSEAPTAGENRQPASVPLSSHSPGTLASVPSFADTQQKWEDPRPYDQGGTSDRVQPQAQAAVRETSLVFVRTPPQLAPAVRDTQQTDIEEPLLEVTPGSRIMAKLQYAISTADAAPVVAQVEYTYAIGDQIVVPAGALIYGHIEQADRIGYVSVKFDEIEVDHKREKIDAIGQSLDMGPIKGKVTGTNSGKNLLVRSLSGIGSTMAMVFGNNTSSAFSEDDLIRERLAENVGTAGDSEVMNLALSSKEVVTVDADTKIYIVFTKHEQNTSTLRKMTSPSM